MSATRKITKLDTDIFGWNPSGHMIYRISGKLVPEHEIPGGFNSSRSTGIPVNKPPRGAVILPTTAVVMAEHSRTHNS